MDKLSIFKAAVEQLVDEGYDAKLHEAYSGRFMYGDTQPAISGDFEAHILAFAVLRAVFEALSETEEYRHDPDPNALFDQASLDAQKIFPGNTDSLGLQKIFY